MNLRRLDCFLAVARELHFRRAAERLHMAQPALSAQIARLEQELGVALFERIRRKVTLTPAGDALVARARLLVPTFRDALAEATSIGQGRAGKLTVGFVGSAAYQLLPRVLRVAEKELPTIQIVLREARSDIQVEALAVGELDLAVTRVPSALPALTSTKIVAEPFVVALPARHPLARNKVVSPKLLDDLQVFALNFIEVRFNLRKLLFLQRRLALFGFLVFLRQSCFVLDFRRQQTGTKVHLLADGEPRRRG